MPAHQKRWGWLLVGALVVLAWATWPFVQTSAFLLDLAGHTGGVRRLLPIRPLDVTTEDLTIPTRWGAVPARLYSSAPVSPHTVVAFPGVHGGGVDEPRLVLFSRRLAATGLNVLSVPLPELRAFRITHRSTDTIEDAVRWVSDQPRLAPRRRVGIVGVSFAGGLALVAAGRPAVAGRISLVVSLGGHGDLGRVLRYLCTGALPDGSRRAPHDYGLAVLALAAAPRIAPPDQAPALERAILTYLEASLDDAPGQPRGRPLFDRVKAEAARAPEPSRAVLHALVARDGAALGRLMLPHVDALAADPALSPERSPVTTVPVFLIHGQEDNVIPSSETPHLAAYLRAAGTPQVASLLTPLLSHLGLDGHADLADRWALVQTWRALRAALD